MRINSTTRYVAQAALAIAFTLSISAQAWSHDGGPGSGGTAGESGTGGSGAGASGGAGDGGTGGSGSGSVPGVYSGRLVTAGARHGTALLTPDQEYTTDVFNACKTSKDVTMRDLKFDGSFSFTSDLSLDMSDTITCMKGQGFTFNGAAVGRSLPLGAK